MNRLFTFFKRILSPLIAGKYWKVRIALICVAYCIVISMPNYRNFNKIELKKSHSYAILIENYNTINNQIDHPFHHNNAVETSHVSKIDFRFVPALLDQVIPSHDLLSRMLGLYIINNIAGFIFFMCILQLVFQYSNNRLFAALVALNFAVLYIGKSFYHDTLLWNDGIAFMFLMFSLLSRNSLVIIVCLVLAYFTDERALFGGALGFVYHRLNEDYSDKPKQKLLYSAIPYLSSFLLYFIIRWLLRQYAGLYTPLGGNSGVSLFLRFQKGYPVWLTFVGGLLAYKSAWAVIAVSIWWLRKRKLDAMVYFFGLLSIMVISVSVQDLTRSLAYAFIALFIGFFLFYKKFNAESGEKPEYYAFTFFMINLCIPTIEIMAIRDFKAFPPIYKLIWPELHSI